jgi:hypothetical protein
VELVKLLNVDLNQIAARAAEIERADQNCSLVLGQLIDKTYVNRIAEEINERLLQQGQVTIGDLTRHYDLPSDFLQMVNTICSTINYFCICSLFELHKLNLQGCHIYLSIYPLLRLCFIFLVNSSSSLNVVSGSTNIPFSLLSFPFFCLFLSSST